MALKKFEGREVVATEIKITKTGDGLSAALEIEPVELAQDEIVYVVMKTTVGDITHKPSKPGARTMVRKHNLICLEATLVEGQLVATALDAQRKRIEDAKGIQRLQLDEQRSQEEDAGR